jgi:hypothetical protein
MSAMTSMRPARRPAPREATTHRFAIGQTVRLKGFGTFPKNVDVYRITGTLPPREDSPQYRIRNDDERYERVTTEDRLEPVGMTPAGERSTLIERTFGNGQRAETQQPRGSKAETKEISAEG